MIDNFSALQSIEHLNNFQAAVLERLQSILKDVDISKLHIQSTIAIKTKKWITISLISHANTDMICTINLLKDRLTIQFGVCEIGFEADHDLDLIELSVKTVLNGQYYSEEFYLNEKLLKTETTIELEANRKCVMEYGLLARLLLRIFKRKIKNIVIDGHSFLRQL